MPAAQTSSPIPSPVKDVLLRDGAVLSADAAQVLHYGNRDREYRYLTRHAGLVYCPGFALWKFSGTDPAHFLHTQTSNDVKGLKTGEGCLTASLTARGRMLGLMVLMIREDHVLASCPQNHNGLMRASLSRFATFSGITLLDLSETFLQFLVIGPAARRVLESAFDIALQATPNYHHREIQGARPAACLIPACRGGHQEFLVLVPKARFPDTWRIIRAAIHHMHGGLAGTRAWDVHRLERGQAVYGMELDEHTIPLEADLEHGISYTKGCYLGQEVISRIHYRGKPPRRFSAIQLAHNADMPEIRTPILADGQQVGTVKNAVHSPLLDAPLAVGLIRASHAAPGNQVTLAGQIGRTIHFPAG